MVASAVPFAIARGDAGGDGDGGGEGGRIWSAISSILLHGSSHSSSSCGVFGASSTGTGVGGGGPLGTKRTQISRNNRRKSGHPVSGLYVTFNIAPAQAGSCWSCAFASSLALRACRWARSKSVRCCGTRPSMIQHGGRKLSGRHWAAMVEQGGAQSYLLGPSSLRVNHVTTHHESVARGLVRARMHVCVRVHSSLF